MGAFPPVRSSAPSGIDAGRIRSVSDLPGAFDCTPSVAPVDLPATPTSPEGVVCVSRLGGNEALFLYYTPDPDARYLALTTALSRAKYVRAGTTWVAGGMIDPGMGSVGGEVYK